MTDKDFVYAAPRHSQAWPSARPPVTAAVFWLFLISSLWAILQHLRPHSCPPPRVREGKSPVPVLELGLERASSAKSRPDPWSWVGDLWQSLFFQGRRPTSHPLSAARHLTPYRRHSRLPCSHGLRNADRR